MPCAVYFAPLYLNVRNKGTNLDDFFCTVYYSILCTYRVHNTKSQNALSVVGYGGILYYCILRQCTIAPLCSIM